MGGGCGPARAASQHRCRFWGRHSHTSSPACVDSQFAQCCFIEGVYLLLSICPQSLGENRKDVLETFTEGPSRLASTGHSASHLRQHTSHSLQGGGGTLLSSVYSKHGMMYMTVQICHTHTDGGSRVCILKCHHTVAQLYLQILLMQCGLYFSVFITSFKQNPMPLYIVSKVRTAFERGAIMFQKLQWTVSEDGRSPRLNGS